MDGFVIRLRRRSRYAATQEFVKGSLPMAKAKTSSDADVPFEPIGTLPAGIWIDVGLHFVNYLSNPYWTEKGRVITIMTQSGTNKQRTNEKREQALTAWLQKIGMTKEAFDILQQYGNREWHLNGQGCIVLPRHQICGGLVQTVRTQPKALRGAYDEDSFRAVVQVSDFVTDRKPVDAKIYSREVCPDPRKSTQRQHQEHPYLENFDAYGHVIVRAGQKLGDLGRIMEHTINTVGIGAARKMGYGRGWVTKWVVRGPVSADGQPPALNGTAQA